MSLNFALSLYANFSMFKNYGDLIKTLVCYSCIKCYDADPKTDLDLKDVFKSIDSEKIKKERPNEFVKYYVPLTRLFWIKFI